MRENSETMGRTPPYNIEAERAILGSILLDERGHDEDRVWDICQAKGISPDMFYDLCNREIYRTMQDMSQADKPIDDVTLREALTAKGKLKAVGGAKYIQALYDQTPTTAHAEYYMDILHTKYLRRAIIERATKIIADAYDENNLPDAKALLSGAQRTMFEIDQRADEKNAGEWKRQMNAAAAHCIARLNMAHPGMEGIPTGFEDVDRVMQGLKKGEMIIIGARPSVGKTALAFSIAVNVATALKAENEKMAAEAKKDEEAKPKSVHFFSLEMSHESLTERFLYGRAGIDKAALSSGDYEPAERDELKKRVEDVEKEFENLPMHVDDANDLDIMQLRARARRWKKNHNTALVVVDYLTLCKDAGGKNSAASPYVTTTLLSHEFKAMARELRVPVIVLSQLSRNPSNRDGGKNGGDDKPRMSDLRESGAIEQDADVIILLHNKDGEEKTKDLKKDKKPYKVLVDIAKNRNGATGEVTLNFDSAHAQFLADQAYQLRKDRNHAKG